MITICKYDSWNNLIDCQKFKNTTEFLNSELVFNGIFDSADQEESYQEFLEDYKDDTIENIVKCLNYKPFWKFYIK